MSETPTAPASERTLARARARGDVPFTNDWTLAAALLGAVAAFAYAGPVVLRTLQAALRSAVVGDAETGSLLLRLAGPGCALLLVPWFAAAVVRVAQRGTSARLSGSSESATRTDRAGKSSHLVTTLVGYLRVAVLAWALAVELRGSLPGLVAAWQRSADELVLLAAQLGRALFLRAAVVLVALGALDLTVQQVMRLRRLRMTRRQVVEEQRELVGDPLWSAERRRQARTLVASSTPLSAATIVVTGAACAAALRYVAGGNQAPVLWLKGEGLAALELVRGAYALGLPLVSEARLASALCLLEPLQAIPEALHPDVAGLLVAAHAVHARRVSA